MHSHHFITVLKILAIEIRQEKEIEDVHIEKEEVKQFLFAIDTTLYINNLTKSTKKNPLELIIEFNNFTRYKINI